MSRVINDTQSLQQVLSGATSVIIRDPVTLLGVLAFLLVQQPKLTLISVVVLPACILPIAIFSRKVRRAAREIQSQSAQLAQIMSESFTGQRVIKAYNLENIVAGEFRETAKKTVGNYMRMVRAGELPGPLIEFFGACGVALMLGYLIFVIPEAHLGSSAAVDQPARGEPIPFTCVHQCIDSGQQPHVRIQQQRILRISRPHTLIHSGREPTILRIRDHQRSRRSLGAFHRVVFRSVVHHHSSYLGSHL